MDLTRRILLIGVALTLVAVAGLGEATPTVAGEWELSGAVGYEGRWFPDEPRSEVQLDGQQGSLLVLPELEWEGGERRTQVRFAPFFRLDDGDDERTHFDMREAYVRSVRGDWELLAGVGQVFWGVTESRHLVNVINQVDGVEDIDEEDRLGQPMLQVGWQRDWGRLDAFVLPVFRERTFAGLEGRPRTPLVVDTDNARYESGAGDRRLDFALRYSHFVGDWDLGVHYFRGTDREPRLLPGPAGDRLVPFYAVIDQVGADLQYTRGAWLWKLESLLRRGQGDRFAAAVAGFEYTFYQVGSSAADIGLLAEILSDGRGDTAPPTALDDDVFVGSRLAFNDTQDTALLAGAIVDRRDGSIAALIEAERRFGQSWTVEVEARLFENVDPGNALGLFDRDSFLTFRVLRNF